MAAALGQATWRSPESFLAADGHRRENSCRFLFTLGVQLVGSGDFKNRNKWYFLVLDNFPTNGRGIQASPLKPCRRIGGRCSQDATNVFSPG